MKKRDSNEVTYEPHYRGFSLYKHRNKTSKGHYVKVLDDSISGLEEMLSHHNKINVIRFDLYLKDSDGEYIEDQHGTSRHVSRFFKNVKVALRKWEKNGKNRGIDRIFYQSVREQSKEKRTHYHCAIAFKAVAQDASRIYDTAGEEYIWAYKIIADTWKKVCKNGVVNFGSKGHCNHFYYIDRNSPYFIETVARCIKGLSYLAKVNTKDMTDNARKFNSSQSLGRGNTPIELIGPLAIMRDEEKAA